VELSLYIVGGIVAALVSLALISLALLYRAIQRYRARDYRLEQTPTLRRFVQEVEYLLAQNAFLRTRIKRLDSYQKTPPLHQQAEPEASRAAEIARQQAELLKHERELARDLKREPATMQLPSVDLLDDEKEDTPT
jgi:hypothetical protein